MLSVVLDNNVVISSIFWGGPSHKVMGLVTSGKMKGFTSDAIVSELMRVLAHFKYRLPDAKCAEVMDLYEQAFEKVEEVRVEADIEDENDLKFLACSARVRADYLVSGDVHLLKLGSFRGTKIVKPAEFLSIVCRTSKRKRQE